MKKFAAVFALAIPLSSATAQEAAFPSWMTGCWEMDDGERWAEECWTIPRAGMMMGSGRAGSGAEMTSWEFMRIEGDDGGALRFAASPGGHGWTAFAAAPDPAGGVTFVNPDNDFPQRVRYWLEGETLNAEISLTDGSNAMRWSFRRMGG
jgi:hypothetical protein